MLRKKRHKMVEKVHTEFTRMPLAKSKHVDGYLPTYNHLFVRWFENYWYYQSA